MVHRPGRPHNFRALSKPKPIKKHEHRHYLPFIPLFILVVSTVLVGIMQQPTQRQGVLAYATNISSVELLNASNQQRLRNGKNELSLNKTLSEAAQAKANDMVLRNYWSHATPDGKEPWTFIDNSGYKYQKAGENLAYGFLTSNEVVTGWMNSSSHKENLLQNSFSEVGFGYANSPDYNGDGPETVVVALYAQPYKSGGRGNESSTLTKPTAPQTLGNELTPITTETSTIHEPATKNVARIQTLTGGNAPWALFAIGVITGTAMAILLIKHAAALRHIIRDSEKFIMHHPLLDSILIGLILFGSFMSQTTGFIR